MTPRRQAIVEELPTFLLNPGQTLGRRDGSWIDIDHYIVRTRENSPPHDYYFRDLTTAYRPGGLEPYDGARMDQLFYNAPGTRYVPAPRHPDLSEYTFQQIDDLVKAVFHFGDDMEWRWPEPHERVYHRPAGGWVGIPLEHLRSMRPNLH